MAKMRAGRQDQFPNRAIMQVTQTVGSTLVFQQVRFGAGLFQGTALIVHRIEWFPDQDSVLEMLDVADYHHYALTNRDDLTELTPQNMNVLVMKKLLTPEGGVFGQHEELPFISDLSNQPGGGLIIPSNPLFLAFDTGGASTQFTLNAVMYYTVRQLSDADYIELVQSLIPVNI